MSETMIERVARRLFCTGWNSFRIAPNFMTKLYDAATELRWEREEREERVARWAREDANGVSR